MFPDTTMPQELVQRCAELIRDAFHTYRGHFKAITRLGSTWFERRDWAGAQTAMIDRMDLYGKAVARVVERLQDVLGEDLLNRPLWSQIKTDYSQVIAYRNDEELAETFFNSVTRAVHTTVGIDRSIEFVWLDVEILPSGDETPVYRSHYRTGTTAGLIERILGHYAFSAPYEDAKRDAAKVASAINAYLGERWGTPEFDSIELLESVFYRNKGAYLVGRLRRASRIIPIILPLLHDERGIVVDTVLLTERAASRVFSFTRFYFYVEAERPGELIGFLHSIIPNKPIAELYIALGHTKHGKTVLYRALHRYLNFSTDRFEIAKGARGMVMTVFTLPSYDLVFKVIKDRFDFPKNTTRQGVKNSYRLVFRHDRVGRLIDAQEFEHLEFDLERFSEDLLQELQQNCASTVLVQGDKLVFEHLYTERRLTPLNLYVEQVSAIKAEKAVIDYGRAIKDLAAADIFPGDLLVKNFGVTRHGRVVFYDYDELCLLRKCKFRHKPKPAGDEEEMASAPWFFVGENDVFPEEFRTFLWRDPGHRAVMERHHGDIFEVEFWRGMQQRIESGEIVDVFPYGAEGRFVDDPQNN